MSEILPDILHWIKRTGLAGRFKMNILILNGSPRPNGNTAAMVRAYASGAAEAGHDENNQSEELLNRLKEAGRCLKD